MSKTRPSIPRVRVSDAPPDTAPSGAPVALFGLATIIGLAVAILALFLFGWLADEMLEGDTLAFDLRVRAAAHDIGLTRVDPRAHPREPAGRPEPRWALLARCSPRSSCGGVGGGARLCCRSRWRGPGVLDTSLKLAFHRTRPTPFFDYALPVELQLSQRPRPLRVLLLHGGRGAAGPPAATPCAAGAGVGRRGSAPSSRSASRGSTSACTIRATCSAGYAVGLIWSSVIIVGDRVAHARARRRGGA